jgi:high affinity Mn2+ porin
MQPRDAAAPCRCSTTRGCTVALLPLLVLGPLAPAAAQTAEPPRWIPQFLGAQFTFIGQYLPRFPALYSGPNSLTNQGDREATHTYGIYFGSRLAGRLQAVLDIEMARGAAVGNALGLAGVTNGDVIRQGAVQLGQGPYIARGYLRYVVPLSRALDTAARAPDQLPGPEPVARLEVKLGKLALTDDFDQNRYANSTRLQFCDWGLFNNTAWDYAADTRGYSYGVMIGWVHPRWTVRLGSFLMPTFANGNVFDWDVARARGDNVELTLQPTPVGTVVRVLAYENHGRMGIYQAALAEAQRTGQPPDIVANDEPGRRKWGVGVNVEQPLGDGGETGAFLRAGWNDGRTEDFVFSEVDRHVSAGVQVGGTHWHRGPDHLALAFLLHGLSADHRAYLAAGGKGFLLGDGAGFSPSGQWLNYGLEEIVETYYRVQLGRYVEISPDVQYVRHPGYNRDRGPVALATLRVNVRY